MPRWLSPVTSPLFHKTTIALALLASLFNWFVPCRGLAEPPEYLARMIDEGNVTFKFYDPAKESRTHRGYTTFRLEVNFRSTYQYRWVDLADRRRILIEPTIDQFTYRLTNEIQLPQELNHDRRWTDPLVKHEFDHVAMTLDPRMRMLIEQVCRDTPNFVRELPPGTQAKASLVDRMIHEVVEPRYQSVLGLLIANENDLDRATHHGRRDLPDRREYFGSLFTEPNLRQHGFPYLNEVKQLLRNKSYREARLPYRLDG